MTRPRGPEWVEPIYLDASALIKLFVQEPESDALNASLLGAEQWSFPTLR